MASRRKGPGGLSWPDSWDVSYEWEHDGVTLESRRHEFRVDTTTRGPWFLFDRHVRSKATDTEWFDGFDPHGGFVAYRPEQVTGVRAVRGKPKPNPALIKGATADLVVYDELAQDGEDPAELPKPRPRRKPGPKPRAKRK